MTAIRRLLVAVATCAAILAAPTPASASGPGDNTYVVRLGDSLYGIARQHYVSLGALLQANDLSVHSVILPGQHLAIPRASAQSSGGSASGSTYTVVRGDSLSSIAARHHVSLGSLLQANGLTITSVILPGHQLELPAGATTPTGTTTSSSANTKIGTVLDYARAQLGKPYAFFTRGPDTFDCSGLTAAAYAQVGITLIHYSAAQALQGSPVDFEHDPIRPGDLIFLKRHGSDTINHVGIAVNSTTWIHAIGSGDTVRIGRLPAKDAITAVRRFIDT